MLLFLAAAVLGYAIGLLLYVVYGKTESLIGTLGFGLGLLLMLGSVSATVCYRELLRRDALDRMWTRAHSHSADIEGKITGLGSGDEHRAARFRLRDEQAALWQAVEDAERGRRDPDTVAVALDRREVRGRQEPRQLPAKPAPARPTPVGASTSEGPQFLQPIPIPLVTPTTPADPSGSSCTDHDRTSSSSDSGCSSSDSSSSSSSDSGG